MGPGRRATTTASKVVYSEALNRGASSSTHVRVALYDAPTSQPVAGTEGSSTASTTKKRGQGLSRGKNDEHLRVAHGPLDVLILDAVGVPVGVNSSEVMTEIGSLRDPVTDEPPHIVDFFHDSHVNKKVSEFLLRQSQDMSG